MDFNGLMSIDGEKLEKEWNEISLFPPIFSLKWIYQGG
jgi:hypothetical protein